MSNAVVFVIPPLIPSPSEHGFTHFNQLSIGDATYEYLGTVDGFVVLVDTVPTLTEDSIEYGNSNQLNGYRIRNTGPAVVATMFLCIRHGPA